MRKKSRGQFTRGNFCVWNKFDIKALRAVIGHKLDLRHATHAAQQRRRVFRACFHANLHDFADFRTRHEIAQRTSEGEFALLDHTDRVAQIRQLRQDVRRNENRLTDAAELLEQFAHLDTSARIQTRRRLIHQQYFRIMNKHAGNCQSLLHAARESVHFAFGLVREISERQHFADRAITLRTRHPVTRRKELQVLAYRHVLIRTHEIGDIANERANEVILVSNDFSIDARFAPGRLEQRGENLNRRSFARAVGANEAEACAFFDREVEIV